MKRRTALLLTLFSYFLSSAQLQYFSPETMNGYTLFLAEKLYLINNCGEQVHSWADVNPSYHVKLLPNGNIVYIEFQTNRIIEKNWDNQIVNEVFPSDPKVKLEYEVIVTPENNYLCVGRYEYSPEEFKETGYNTDSIGFSPQVDIVVEIDRTSGATLWLWDIMDHVIQERSDTIPNYGIVADHPELLNLDAISTFDWQTGEAFMINGIDYNPTLDQIVCSLRKMGEIVIIDHSTTTEEAASHQGGNMGKGGDLLYRWGNPKNYQRGTIDEQQLFYQHNPNWIQYGEHAGGIIIYDNGLDRPGITYGYDYSTVPIIIPPIQSNNSYSLGVTEPFLPLTAAHTIGGPNDPNSFNSRFTSGAKVLENENTLVAVGNDVKILEFLPDGTLVWEYQLANANFLFRVEKYPLSYPAFINRDLKPMGTIEQPPSTVPCTLVSSIKAHNNISINAWFDFKSSILNVDTDGNEEYQINIYSMDGKKLWEISGAGNQQYQIPNLATGMLYVNIFSDGNFVNKILKIVLL